MFIFSLSFVSGKYHPSQSAFAFVRHRRITKPRPEDILVIGFVIEAAVLYGHFDQQEVTPGLEYQQQLYHAQDGSDVLRLLFGFILKIVSLKQFPHVTKQND